MSQRTVGGQLAKDYVDKFKNTPSRQLARVLREEYPEVFVSFDSAYNKVRYYRGAKGVTRSNIGKEERVGSKLYAKDGEPTTPDKDARVPKSYAENWTHFHLPSEQRRWLVIADWHVPFHDETAVLKIAQHARAQGCKGVLINGDFMDAYQLSKFERNPTERAFRDEVEDGKKMLGFINEFLEPDVFIWKLGNHEERYYRYLFDRAPELYGIEELEWENIFALDDHGVQLVGEQRPVVVDESLYVIHGHEFSKNMLSPVNPARGVFLRGHACAVVAHSHIPSNHSEPDFGGQVTSCWSIGCGCNLHPKYRRMNRWMHGHGILNVDEQGKWEFFNYKLVKDRVVTA
jgi:predicted phosphodiesterase